MITEEQKKKVLNLFPELEKFDPEIPKRTFSIDWGFKKRQGKRCNGTIVGSMSDISLRGIKEYTVYDLDEYAEDIDKDEKFGFYSFTHENYIKARMFGLNHVESVYYSIMKYKE